MKKFLSRKFLVTGVGAACTVALMAVGWLEPELGVKILLAHVGAYLGIEGILDMLSVKKKE